jgi:hypothetical protein
MGFNCAGEFLTSADHRFTKVGRRLIAGGRKALTGKQLQDGRQVSGQRHRLCPV